MIFLHKELVQYSFNLKRSNGVVKKLVPTIIRHLELWTGTGGGNGGSNSFTSAFPSSKPVSGNFPISGTVGNHTLTSNQLPSHTHANGGSVTLSPGGGDVRSGGGWSRSTPSTGNNTTNASSHNHGFSSGSASFSSNINLAVQYIDVIVCSFS